MAESPLVSIVMGSDSDLEIMNEAAKALDDFGIPYEIDVTSAHRSPARTGEFARCSDGEVGGRGRVRGYGTLSVRFRYPLCAAVTL